MAASDRSGEVPNSPQVHSWRIYTREEMLEYIAKIQNRSVPKKRKPRRNKPAILVIRDKISTLDMYCYFKARFGEPNGFQTFIAADDSNNWIHWDYNIKAGDADLHFTGMSRETHVMTSEDLSDEQWRDLVLNIKADFARVGKAKSDVLKSLEKWALFRNKFVEIAELCSQKHDTITDYTKRRPVYQSLVPYRDKRRNDKWSKKNSEDNKRRAEMASACLELSLLTPVMAEAFLNMLILILCKPEVRSNKRLLDGLIRSQIDVKVSDLQYKCVGFVSGIDATHPAFVKFKRVMDKRNHAIHGNIDPEREKVEFVFFERKRPLFSEPGDHIGKFIESIERQAQPESVIEDYEDTHEFLAYIASCLDKTLQQEFWQVMEDHYPGFDVNRKKAGSLLPNHIILGRTDLIKYDSELAVVW